MANKAKVSIEDVLAAVEDGGNTGFCVACGDSCDGVEPDARGYLCDNCGKHEVYGAEELLLRMA